MGILEAKGVSKIYHMGKTVVHALKNVNLTIDHGQFACVAGPSGAGKSTLLNLLGLIDNPTHGSITLDGNDVSGLSKKKLHNLRKNKIGFIFQSFNLVPILTAFENIEFPLIIRKWSKKERTEKIQEIAAQVGILDYLHHKPDELSGGQRQRVAIARSLVTEPEIVLADEPTANLDQKTGITILDLMRTLNTERKTSFIIASHDDTVMSYSNRLIKVIDGEIRE